ncbi:meiotically up-regulated 80 protein [Blastomyces gilchristii SLH14081]|uniref:Meiotically up-regulated 80 protein n=1 Tax=Blastomyces gilchristii (strain SLH14081) TaxID=559298 RepID=A0A179URP5_BLAGS|nr:meiotically up-regulated 80 protein [Blastomyces gilchristii SLH14081]OAT10520.1 meiotically up-regulated 80 protein [Blastomyces gilchristii SLH14081]
MPSFFSSTLSTFPPTPPHVIGSRLESETPFYQQNNSAYAMRFPQNGYDFIEKFSQTANANYQNHGPMTTHSQPLHPLHGGREMGSSQTMVSHQALPQAIYGTVNPPILPPIRSSTKLPPMDNAIPPQYRRQEKVNHQDSRPKEEKPTGGVAAHLDYEMGQMSDFVAEMAQGMYALYISKIVLADIDFARSVYPGTTVPPQFRKYVSQILSSTRLPSSTILLGLYYLACRMRMLSAADVYKSGSSQVYRMLTTALLLGSKFLDDNTFQNRSWAEVSNIPVAELNAMELEWLFGFEWNIHNRIHNKQDGFKSWKAHWDTWRAKADARANESRSKLAPIDTNIQRQHASQQKAALLSPDGPIPPQYQRGAWLSSNASDYSPPSAPHSGPNTPDYYRPAPWAYSNPPPPYSRGWVVPQQYIPPAPRSQPPSYHHTPSYTHAFSPTGWTGHGSSCGCLYCAKHQEHYLHTVAFAIQPVAG